MERFMKSLMLIRISLLLIIFVLPITIYCMHHSAHPHQPIIYENQDNILRVTTNICDDQGRVIYHQSASHALPSHLSHKPYIPPHQLIDPSMMQHAEPITYISGDSYRAPVINSFVDVGIVVGLPGKEKTYTHYYGSKEDKGQVIDRWDYYTDEDGNRFSSAEFDQIKQGTYEERFTEVIPVACPPTQALLAQIHTQLHSLADRLEILGE